MIVLTEEIMSSAIAMAINKYQDVLKMHDQEFRPEMRQLYSDVAYRLRRLWKERVGLDNLHDIACGEVLSKWTGRDNADQL